MKNIAICLTTMIIDRILVIEATSGAVIGLAGCVENAFASTCGPH
jgi:hypothetical protein